ncbi:MAG: calcium/sodium antiporter [Gemmatimonadota bacterium]|nr:calcium/sodium antiporter [Gemmatimonadota bacterium]
MAVTIALLVGALALLYVGGEALVRGASTLASQLGVSALAIGLTVVAFGTSTPELAVSVDAALAGAIDISVGNVVGSNIANVTLILGLAALIRPAVVQAKVVLLDTPLMILASVALVGVLANGVASRLEGALLVLGLAIYVVFTFWEGRRESGRIRDEFSAAVPKSPTRAIWSVIFVLVGLGLLAGGGHLLVTVAVSLATSLGVSQATIGLTIVAVGTSLPELATSVIASARGQGDIAVGNVVGSNMFNILGILGTTAVIHPLRLGGISVIDLGTMVAASGALMILLYARHRLGRVAGSLLLASFVAYVGWLIAA